MLGDVLLIEEKHRRVGAEIVEKILEIRKGRFIIGISGESGSGKSELGHVIARGLVSRNIMAKSLSADNFYRVAPSERKQWRQRQGIEKSVGVGEYDWVALERMVQDFKRGVPQSTFPCVDLVTEQVDVLTTDFSGVEALVLDGLYSIKSPNVDFRIFIDLTFIETKKAQLLRGKEPQNEYRTRVLEQEHEAVRTLRASADLIVTGKYELSVPAGV